jgi:flagellar motor switch/type III secretory pathway protein FliN
MNHTFPSFDPENKKITGKTSRESLLNDVAIPYCVQVGKGDVTYENLTALNHGDLLPLNASYDELFELKVGHGTKKTICYGHIVEVEGQLYFQVKKIT